MFFKKWKRAVSTALSVTALTACFASCSGANGEFYSPYYEHDFGKTIKAEIVIKDIGIISLDLYPDVAPITVKNFCDLAKSGFYDNLIIHRVVPGFVIQGGDPTGTGYGLEGQKSIKGEFASNGVSNSISHVRGVISMARKSNDMDSATSQFFIMLKDKTQPDYLNGNYAAFGCVTSGMNVADTIAGVDIDPDTARPISDVVIETVRILD